MTAQAQVLNRERWTATICLRPAPILFYYRAFFLGLIFYAMAGWHAALLSLTIALLMSSPDSRGAERLRCGPHRWLWRTDKEHIFYHLVRAYRGPFWHYIVLQDDRGEQRKLTLWRFTMSATAWRRLNVLLQAKRWQELALR